MAIFREVIDGAIESIADTSEGGIPIPPTRPSSSERLRELENIRRDGLISEDEYRAKNAERYLMRFRRKFYRAWKLVRRINFQSMKPYRGQFLN